MLFSALHLLKLSIRFQNGISILFNGLFLTFFCPLPPPPPPPPPSGIGVGAEPLHKDPVVSTPLFYEGNKGGKGILCCMCRAVSWCPSLSLHLGGLRRTSPRLPLVYWAELFCWEVGGSGVWRAEDIRSVHTVFHLLLSNGGATASSRPPEGLWGWGGF